MSDIPFDDLMDLTISFALPGPPSANNCFVNNPRTRGRFSSSEYKAWQREAHFIWDKDLKRRDMPCMIGLKKRWVLYCKMEFPTKAVWKSDIDNRIKPLLDFICKATGLDDRYLLSLHCEKVHAKNCLRLMCKGDITIEM